MRRARILLPLLFVWAILGAEDCTESTINEQINETFGIDTDSPVQVAGAILLGQTFGSAEEQKAAEMGSTLKDFRRADHEQKGDRLRESGKFEEAMTEYDTALKWIGSGPQQERKRADLEVRMGRAAHSQALQTRERIDAMVAGNHFRDAARMRERDREFRDSPQIADLHANAANSYYMGSAYDRSCESLRRANALGYKDTRIAAALRDRGHPCE